MIRRFWRLAPLLLALAPAPAGAAGLIVVEARGGRFAPGQTIPADKPVSLAEGERLVLLGSDGRSVTLRGAYSGAPLKAAASSTDPKMALAALVATRNARATSVGVTRSGGDLSPLPDPWLIDVDGPGPRCLRAGQTPVWWRPVAKGEDSFTVYPVDRSWRADFHWTEGQSSQPVPPLSRFEGENAFLIETGGREFAIKINVLPATLDGDLMLVGWMLEKGCLQQADALLRQLSKADGSGVAGPAQDGKP